MKKVSVFVTVTLGALTAFGPFLTDFYLPALPELAEYFKTSPSAVSSSLTASMIGLAGGQILIGPLSDKYGRRWLLILSMLLFCISTVFCIYAPNIEVFNLMRVFQGVSGAGGVVLSKSIATDMFSGEYLAKFLALLGAINGIAPITAPIIGGTMTNFTSWRGIFCLLLVIGIILMYCSTRLKETLPALQRTRGNLLTAYAKLFVVFRNSRFSLSTVAMMCSFFTFFAYISSSPFIFQQEYGLTALEYSMCFATNAFFIAVGAMLSSKFRDSNAALKCGAANFALSAMLVALCQSYAWPLLVLMPCYIYMLLSFGMMQPVCMAIAMDSERDNAGAASAVFGASSFVAGAVVSPIVTIGNVMTTSAAVIFGGAALCLLFALPLCAIVKRTQTSLA